MLVGAGTVFNMTQAVSHGRTATAVIGLALVAMWVSLLVGALVGRRRRSQRATPPTDRVR